MIRTGFDLMLSLLPLLNDNPILEVVAVGLALRPTEEDGDYILPIEQRNKNEWTFDWKWPNLSGDDKVLERASCWSTFVGSGSLPRVRARVGIAWKNSFTMLISILPRKQMPTK